MASFSADTIIDIGGDLTLIVGAEREQQESFFVARQNIMQASSVWHDMLSGDYHKATTRLLDFPNDDPSAFAILLLIAHLRFDEVPEHVSFQLLLNLAITVDKYNLVVLIRPFWKAWIKSRPDDDHSRPGHEEWLYVMYAFGMEDAVRAMATHLAQSLTLKEPRRARKGSTEVFIEDACPSLAQLESLQLPAGMLDSILQARITAFNTIFHLCSRTIKRANRSVNPFPRVCLEHNLPFDKALADTLKDVLRSCGWWPVLDRELLATMRPSLQRIPRVLGRIEEVVREEGEKITCGEVQAQECVCYREKVLGAVHIHDKFTCGEHWDLCIGTRANVFKVAVKNIVERMKLEFKGELQKKMEDTRKILGKSVDSTSADRSTFVELSEIPGVPDMVVKGR